jgi:signal transduction histidine kinase
MGSKAVAERKRVEAVVETLAAIHNHGESLVELAHDARNMVTALSLYCDLLEEPGVLPAPHRHYGSELRLVAEASRRLVEKLAHLDAPEERGRRPAPESSLPGDLFRSKQPSGRPSSSLPALESTGPGSTLAGRTGLISSGLISTGADPVLPNPADDLLIGDVREELLASRNVLAAIAGPSIAVIVEADGGARPVQMRSEELIRVLVNLVRNAAEAIGAAGTIRLALSDRSEGSAVVLTVDDTGAGIAEEQLDRVFEPGFTTRAIVPSGTVWASGNRRGLGLAITRSIVEAAGGTIHAGNRPGGGARFVIELPVRAR